MAERNNPWFPFNSYEEWLAQFANGYSEQTPENMSRVPAGELMQGVTIDAKQRLKSNRLKTGLILAGLALGTIVTGGALGFAIGGAGILGGALAGLGTVAGVNAGIGIGAGILGVSAGALGIKWKMVYNTLNPWASRDPQVIQDRFVVKEDRFNRRMAKLEQRMKEATNEQERADLKALMEKEFDRHEKFLMKYDRQFVHNSLRLKCQAGIRERAGVIGALDKARQAGRNFAGNTLGIDYWDEKFDKSMVDSRRGYRMVQGAIDHASELRVKYGIPANEKLRASQEKNRREANNWMLHPILNPSKNRDYAEDMKVEEFAGETAERYQQNESEVEKAIRDVYKNGKTIKLEDVKQIVTNTLNDNGKVADRYTAHFINVALEKGDFSNAEIEANADMMIYLIESGEFDNLTPKAQEKVAKALNNNKRDINGYTTENFVNDKLAEILKDANPADKKRIAETQARMQDAQNNWAAAHSASGATQTPSPASGTADGPEPRQANLEEFGK